jgi:uncharacterized protein YyaL (SSP411 family)
LGEVLAADPPKGKKANRLAKESSPYLLQHAHNPVDWYPWGPEAFARAKKERKLVFLSIGYSSCHWCHVMEKESFSHEEVAKILNEHFVCIKVDREERPEIDQIYMSALYATGRRGGWPLSMFLTADGKPIVGGTYWPREDREIDGQMVPGFKTLLHELHAFATKNPEQIEKQAEAVAEATSELLKGTARGIPIVNLDRELVTGAIDELREEYDKVHGGFGSSRRDFQGPKFPTPPYLRFLQVEAARRKSAELGKMVHHTLDRMAMGGIYDHLGGGFHRYSTERTWTVPHFEKMLYDNAQLCELYAVAYAETKKPLYRRTLEETLAFLKREMTSPEGGFYSALDADSEEEEGRFYVWTPKELEEILPGDEAGTLFRKAHGLDGPVNFEGKYHILTLPAPLEEVAAERKLSPEEIDRTLSPIKRRLFEARAKRPRPFLDTKILTEWNGQMIAGLALAGQALGDKEAVEGSRRAANFVLKNLKTPEGRLMRVYAAAPGEKPKARLNGYIVDYAFFVHGLLTLHDVTGEERWLDEAKGLTEVMIKHHMDEKTGGFYYTSHDHEELFARAKDQYDGAQPSGNSVAARNFVRLWQKTGEEKYAQLAEKTFKALAGTMKSNPSSVTAMVEALALHLDAKEKKKP